MAAVVVSDKNILATSRGILAGTKDRLWVASAWIRADALRALLGADIEQRINDGLDVRVVFRVKEPADLDITELHALDSLTALGGQVRFSRRLHAKTVIGDSEAVVGSSNLTPTAGFGTFGSSLRNEELGIHVSGDPATISGLEAEFLTIWDNAEALDDTVRGVAMVESVIYNYSFVVTDPVRVGEYVSALTPNGDLVIGRVTQIMAFNPSFPELSSEAAAKPAWNAGRKARPIPAISELFADRSKNRGLLITTTFFNADSLFHIADVDVLKHQLRGTTRLVAPSVPVSPGSLVRRADPVVLGRLLNGPQPPAAATPFGTVHHHGDVPVHLNTDRLRTLHAAVMGMTGSGKSNALKHLVKSMLETATGHDRRIVIVDTHGEYTLIADKLSTEPASYVDVRLRTPILDEDTLKSLAGLRAMNSAVEAVVEETIDDLPDYADINVFLAALDVTIAELKEETKPSAAEKTVLRALLKLRERTETRTDELCLRDHEAAVLINPETKEPVTLDQAGLWILNLRADDDPVSRSLKCAAVATHVYETAKNDPNRDDPWRALLVVDEAHNYAPERYTGQESRSRASIDALHRIAAEGRKFKVGVILATQRPARLSKEVLAQCNTQIVFRLTNAEDQQAVAATFEEASDNLINQLASLDTGTCITGGAAITMPTHIDLPEFGV